MCMLEFVKVRDCTINSCTECPYYKTCTDKNCYGLNCKFRIEEEIKAKFNAKVNVKFNAEIKNKINEVKRKK